MATNENAPGRKPEASNETNNQEKISNDSPDRNIALAVTEKILLLDEPKDIADLVEKEFADLRRWVREYHVERDLAREERDIVRASLRDHESKLRETENALMTLTFAIDRLKFELSLRPPRAPKE